MKREFTINGIEFYIANYNPRRNEYERGLKYDLMMKDYFNYNAGEYTYRSTGAKFETMRGCKDYARREIARWM